MKLSKTQKMMLTMMAGKYKRNSSKACGRYQKPEDMDSYTASYALLGTCEKRSATKIVQGASVDYHRDKYHEFRKSTVEALLTLGLIKAHIENPYATTYHITEAGTEQVAMIVNEHGLWWHNV